MKQNTFSVRQVIGEKIREGRRHLGLTQEQFAEVVGLSFQFLSILENGMQFARMDTYCRIAEALSLPLYVLFQEKHSGDDALDAQLRFILSNCDSDEKRALLNIVIEIKTLLAK